MPDEKRIIVSMPTNLLEKLDEYAKNEVKGNRTIAVYQIVKTFLEEQGYVKG